MLWPSFIHHQRAAKKLLAVECCDDFFRLAIVANFGEAKTARLARKAIAQ
jgi:hypothetical protein